MARQVLENGVVLPAEYSDDWYDDMTSNLTKLDDVIGSDSEKLSSADVGAAALSNNYNDLDNLPTIPTVNDATLTIQKNGVDVQTFTANASSNVTCNITVPTKTSDLTNDSNFVDTSNPAVSSGITSAKVTSYDTHIADTDIHVTTADKNKWNNNITQSYVFRYSSTALVASSTNSNTLLDNTDNLKVGDKVIDSSGVLFSITAIDTANSTFTVGSALVDLALDANVVHTSGDETVGGAKTFSSNVNVYNSDSTANVPNLVLKNSIAERGVATSAQQTIYFTDKNDANLGYINVGVTATAVTQIVFRAYDSNNQSDGFSLRKTATATVIQPSTNNTVNLGTSSGRWKDVQSYLINGLEPSALGMPVIDRTKYVDISSYFTNTGTGEYNSYSVPANGWIFLRLGTISSCQASVLDSDSNPLYGISTTGGVEQVLLPVIAGTTFQTQWATGSTVTVATAHFIPCQGNV